VLPEGFRLPFSTGIAGYSTIIAWDKQKLGEGPQNWAEFWDVRRFPGKRTMRRSMHAVLEAALMADGVAPDKVYPIDVDRAFRKVREIKDHVIWWNAGADSQQLLRTGEVTAGAVWSTRARLTGEDTQGRIAYRWNQGLVHAAVWVVPKGPPAGRDWAMRFVDSTLVPERQVALLRALGTGPANPAAAALVPPELKPHNPMDPDNLRLQLVTDEPWYAQNYIEVFSRFSDLITS
jgi:putative spermidine/putrescine transport system substrate-binding protein